MKLDHGRSKYYKRYFCVATLHIYFWFICSARSFHLDKTFQLDETFHVFLTNHCNLFTKQAQICADLVAKVAEIVLLAVRKVLQ